MIATNPGTLRAAVILLLRKSGYTPIEATNKWNTVYSRQIQQAGPGKHRFIIGAYTLEFTNPGDGEPKVIATDPEPGFPLAFVALAVILAVIVCALLIF